MRLLRNRSAQSVIEYAILLAIVISAFLLLQGIVKRGVSGGINDAASRMGEQYSVTSTAYREKREMTGAVDQVITEETGTSMSDTTLTGILTATGGAIHADSVKGSVDLGAHNITQRLNQNFTSTTESKTEGAKQEKYKFSDAQDHTVDDFALPGSS
ncbi:MAG: hypothetical protein FJZ10_05320 [Candidatus Omnitrophica bacterium]|nr:hypothetical protein [Candidatus Omnitrophota bacterium]